jgi:exo-1,4-beta-D-glucosaminidase
MLVGKPACAKSLYTAVLLSMLTWLAAAQTKSTPVSDPPPIPNPLPLSTSWQLQSSCIAKEDGELISSSRYQTKGWLKATVPGTVLGSQVADGVFPDPYFGMNLRKIPGTDYPKEKIFGYLPMSADSPYSCSWWYRTEFATPATKDKLSSWLHFNGINYSANIWINGKKVADRSRVAGAFRAYDFDVSGYITKRARNVLAVEVFAQTENDLGIDFLDWNPAPADKSMGLWRDVFLRSTGPVTVDNPAVITHFTSDDLLTAELLVVADVANHSDRSTKCTVRANVGSVLVEQRIELAANESRSIQFNSAQYPQLRIEHPRIWWPYQYGEPYLQHLHISTYLNSAESDSKTVRFGVREVKGTLNEHGFLQFKVNRRNILIRGGGWTPDLLYREPSERLRNELSYLRAMHLNTIRLEGKLGSDALFDLADEMGILVMAGWQCCDHWQKWDKWNNADREIAHDSLYNQITRLRAHPSLLAWMNGSDEAPPPLIEKDALVVMQERHWPNAIMSSAANRTSSITGSSGVKMSGPYDYVPPEYWYLDKDKVGGAFGFNTETSPGVAIPDESSIRRTLPNTSWWPIDEQWKYHAGLGKFAQYDHFNTAMSATYGRASSLHDYEKKAQLLAYDGERSMFEAYGANKYTSTGVIQWMLNNAWPSFIWHLYDYYLVPGGGYFGTRKANEPLHIQYRYDDRSVVIVNSTLADYKGLLASAELLDLGGKVLSKKKSQLDVEPDGTARAFLIPSHATTAFLKLELRAAQGTVISENFYWLPAKLADLDWSKSTYVNTPAITYADMQDLQNLPPADITIKGKRSNHDGAAVIHLHNSALAVAFFLQVQALRPGSDEELAPLFWNDNFISLLPGESRDLRVTGLPPGPIEIKLDGWNVKSTSYNLTRELEARDTH